MADSSEHLPSWLNKDFVQKILRASDGDSTITVTSCEFSLAYTMGDGYSSDLHRIIAKLQNSQEYNLIVKCQPEGGAREEFLILVNAFDKETKMLSETLPGMCNLLREADLRQYEPFGPKCFSHGEHPVKFIVMEDLRHSGFILPKRIERLDLDHCSMSVRRLAWFHAASAVLYDRDPASIKCYEENMYSERGRRHMAPLFSAGMDALIDEVSSWPQYEEYVSKLKKLKDTLFDSIIAVYKRKDEDFNTLIHGDYWINNLMFRYSENAVRDMRILDYQAVYVSSPVLDLQHFLNTCPTDEVRIDYIDDLIQLYYNTLVETLHLLGYNKDIPSHEHFQKKFSDCSIYGFAVAALVLPAVLSEDVYDLESAFSEDSGDVNPNRKMLSNKRFVETMKRLLPMYAQSGVI